MILNGFLFLDENDTTGFSADLICSNARQLALSVEQVNADPIELEVLGVVDMKGGTAYPLGVVNASDLSTAASISDEGIYYIPLDGVNAVCVANNGTPGNCIVFGTLTD